MPLFGFRWDLHGISDVIRWMAEKSIHPSVRSVWKLQDGYFSPPSTTSSIPPSPFGSPVKRFHRCSRAVGCFPPEPEEKCSTSGLDGRRAREFDSVAVLSAIAKAIRTNPWLCIAVLMADGARRAGVILLDLQGPVFLSEPAYKVEFSNNSGGLVDCTGHGSPPPDVSMRM
ncbi:AGAP007091-PA-like protein [Anopheles sinensis]|uniref:AGAP007091-PA-like protein n=1 Tax=Anopheles sinensis TaxID=74873 RepID=A0A084VZ28_ANOSI|nr:AGAP007091-PA-like protein [Anopheles sinensis]